MTAPYRYTVQVQFVTTRQVEIESYHDLTCGEIHDQAVAKAKREICHDSDVDIRTGAMECISAAMECVSAPGKEPSA